MPSARSLALLLAAITSIPAASVAATWEARGVMSDACQCELFCPCEFLSKPSFGNCDDAAILHIERGKHGDVTLDGLEVAVVSASPAGERLVDSVGNLTFARILVPNDVTDAQRDALADVARRVFGAWIGETARISAMESVERVDLKTTVEGHRHTVKVPGILDLEIEPVVGGDGKTPVILKNNAFTAVGFGDVVVSQSKVYRYKDDERDWKYDGRSASTRTFAMGGEVSKGAGPESRASAPAPAGGASLASSSSPAGVAVAGQESERAKKKSCCTRHGVNAGALASVMPAPVR